MSRDPAPSSKPARTYYFLVVLAVFGIGIIWYFQHGIDSQNSDSVSDSTQDYEQASSIHHSGGLKEEVVGWPTEAGDGEVDSSIKSKDVIPKIYLKDGSMSVGPFALYDTIYNLREVFEKHYLSALGGDPESMYQMSMVALNCEPVGDHQSLDELSKSMLEKLSTQEQLSYWQDSLRYMERLFPDCVYINSHKPAGDELENIGATGKPLDWKFWLDAAKEAGHPIAALRGNVRGETSNTEYIKLLDTGVRTKRHEAMRIAHNYIMSTSKLPRKKAGLGINENDPRDLILELWEYLECKYHPNCNLAARELYLEENFYPRDVESIVSAANRFEQRIQDPTPIDFSMNLNIDEILKSD